MKDYLKNLFRVFTEPSMLFNSLWRHDVYYGFKCFFNPKQKWLTKEIPNTWCDKVELIPRLLFASLIHFVEKENGLSQLNVNWDDDLKAGFISQEYIDNVNKTYGELKDVYEYVKNEREGLHKLLSESYPPFPLPPEMKSMKYEELYGETNRIEELICNKDRWAMHTIVTHVGCLWT